MNVKTKKIPIQNYIYLGLIFIGVVFLLIYFNSWYKVYREERLSIPIMSDFLVEIKYEEISNYVAESKDLVLYVSKADDEETRNFEKKLKRKLKKNYLKEEVLYLNVSSITDDILKNSKQLYGTNFMSDTPNITIFDNGIISDIYNIDEFDVNKTIEYIKGQIKELEKGI